MTGGNLRNLRSVCQGGFGPLSLEAVTPGFGFPRTLSEKGLHLGDLRRGGRRHRDRHGNEFGLERFDQFHLLFVIRTNAMQLVVGVDEVLLEIPDPRGEILFTGTWGGRTIEHRKRQDRHLGTVSLLAESGHFRLFGCEGGLEFPNLGPGRHVLG